MDTQVVVLLMCDFDSHERFSRIQNRMTNKFRNQTKGLLQWFEKKSTRLMETFLEEGIPIEFILDKEVIYATLYDQIQNNSHAHNDDDYGYGAFKKFIPNFIGNFVRFSEIPKELLHDKQFIAEHLKYIGSEPFLKYMDKNFIEKEKKFLSRVGSNICTTLGYKFRDDEDFMLDMSTHHYGGGLIFFSIRLKLDRNFMLKVSQNGKLVNIPSDVVEDDEIRLNWFKKDYNNFRIFGDRYVRNLDFIRKCLEINVKVITLVPHDIIKQHEDLLDIEKKRLHLLKKLKSCTTALQVIELMDSPLLLLDDITIVPPLEMNETLLLLDKYPKYIKVVPEDYYSDWNLLKKMKSFKEKNLLNMLKVSVNDNNQIIALLEMGVKIYFTESQEADREFLLKISKLFGEEQNFLRKVSKDLFNDSEFVAEMIKSGSCNFHALESPSEEMKQIYKEVCGIYKSISNLDELRRLREKRLNERYLGLHLAKHLEIDLDYTFYYWPLYD